MQGLSAPPPPQDEEEHSDPLTGRTGTFSVSWGGGGVPSPFIFREDGVQSDNGEDGEPEVSIETGDQQGDPIPNEYPGTTLESGKEPESKKEEESDDKEESDDEQVIQQPIPFQMGVTPMADEGEVTDELQTWYEGTEDSMPQARGSTDPVPKKTPKPRPKPIMRERSPRNLRNRQVARSILSQPKAKVHWNLQAQGRTYRKSMSPEQMKMEWDLHEPDIIQVHLELIEEYPKWHRNWSLLMDPVGKGMAEVLEATVQHVRTTKKEMKRLMKTLPLDPLHMENGFTVL